MPINQAVVLFGITLSWLAVFSCCASPAKRDPVVWHFLTTDMAASVAQEWRHARTDASISGQPIRIAGRCFEKGLGTHAPGEMVFILDCRHHRFKADVGVDDQGGKTGSVIFLVKLDGRKAFNSGLMKFGQEPKRIQLDTSGVQELRLIVTDGGDGYADWANASVDDIVVAKPVPHFSTAGFYTVAGDSRSV